jgi:hypothetical protein
MGTKIFDQYTYLHFAVGIIAYFWNLSLKKWLMIHTIFEISENTQFGMDLINNNMSFWPGGKPKADAFINIIGDTIGTTIGWLSAYYIDKLGSKYDWYNMHII